MVIDSAPHSQVTAKERQDQTRIQVTSMTRVELLEDARMADNMQTTSATAPLSAKSTTPAMVDSPP